MTMGALNMAWPSLLPTAYFKIASRTVDSITYVPFFMLAARYLDAELHGQCLLWGRNEFIFSHFFRNYLFFFQSVWCEHIEKWNHQSIATILQMKVIDRVLRYLESSLILYDEVWLSKSRTDDVHISHCSISDGLIWTLSNRAHQDVRFYTLQTILYCSLFHLYFKIITITWNISEWCDKEGRSSKRMGAEIWQRDQRPR